METTNLLFVYGTLKGKHLPSYLRDATVEGLTLYRVSPRFPGAVASPEGKVCGELHLLQEGDLIGLDRYEGVPDLYTRDLITTAEGEKAWVYKWARGVDNTEHIGSTW